VADERYGDVTGYATGDSTGLGPIVARSADAAGLHASVSTLLLELLSELGALASTATAATERGRGPFRPRPSWAGQLGQLGYRVYLLADQTGIDLAAEVREVAESTYRNASDAQEEETGWPFDSV
jgi:hypothetical protein